MEAAVIDRVLSRRAEHFLCATIGSLQKLDCLVLLGNDRSRWWSAAAVARRIGMPVEAVTSALEDLSRGHLLDVRVATDVVFRYAPWHRDAEVLMVEIAAQYDANRNALADILVGRSPV